MTQFRAMWMSGNKDIEVKETLYFILFCMSFSPIHVSVRSFLIETNLTYRITYAYKSNSQF